MIAHTFVRFFIKASLTFVLFGFALFNECFAGVIDDDASSTTAPIDPCIFNSPSCPGFWGVGAAPDAYKIECNQTLDKAVKTGDLEITDLYDANSFRCFRVVTGNLIFNAVDPDNDIYATKYFALPFLEKVVGNLVVNGNEFNTLILSRLQTLEGDLDLDFRPMFERLRIYGLTTLNEVNIKTRDASNDFTGFKNVSFVDMLTIDDKSTDDAAAFGFNSLEAVNDLTLKGSTLARQSGSRVSVGMFEKLSTVNNDLHIQGSMNSLWMLEKLEYIGGNLTINAQQLDDFSDLSLLTTLVGQLNIVAGGNIDQCDINALAVQLNKASPLTGC